MAGLWSHLDELPLLPEEEESDRDIKVVGPGRSSGLGHTDEEPNLLGLQFGNTRRMGIGENLSVVLSPNGICRVCENVVSVFCFPRCTLCNRVVHPDCCTQFGIEVAVCHRCVGERSRQIESCQRAWTTHRVATDLGRSATRSAEIAGHVLGFSTASTVKAVVEWGRSTVRGMWSVMQRDDDDVDDEGVQQREIEDDAGALQGQNDLLTRRLAKAKDADDEHDSESVGADVGDTSQAIPEASQAMFHQGHTPRLEQDTSSKLDGNQEYERNAKRTTFSGSVFFESHSQGTPKFVQAFGSARVKRRNSFSGSEFSGSYQYDRD